MRRLLNVLMRTTELRGYIAGIQDSGCRSPITTARGVCNDYNIPKADVAAASMSAYLCDDEKLHQPALLEREKKKIKLLNSR